MNNEKKPFKDDAQWLAECLRVCGFEDISKQLNEIQKDPRYELMMAKYNRTKRNDDFIKWHKSPNDIKMSLDNLLDYEILEIFLKGSSNYNLLVISQDQLSAYLKKDLKYVKQSIKRLLQKGYIAKAIKGNKKRPTTYMVSPHLRTQGTVNKKELQDLFNSLIDATSIDLLKYLAEQKIYTYRLKTNHKVDIDFNDVNTLPCNVFSLTEIIDEDNINEKQTTNKSQNEKQKQDIPQIEISNDLEENLPFN